MRVLVVDDDPGMGEMLTCFLEVRGDESQVATALDAALEILRAWQPELVLCDGQFPASATLGESPHFTSCLLMVGACQLAGVPILLITGKDCIVEEARSLGLVARLKPIGITELNAAMQEAVAGR